MIRRLPVVQSAASDERPERSSAYRVGVGALVTVALWVPLVLVLAPIGTSVAVHLVGAPRGVSSGAVRWSERDAAEFAALAAVPILCAFGLAAFGNGFVARRFANAAPRRDAALAGGIAAICVAALAGIGRSGASVREAALAFLAFAITGVLAGSAGASFRRRGRDS